jgi:hypothetical protein
MEFYEKSFQSGYLGFDYPFGMWYFGSIIMKVTGLDAFEFVSTFMALLIFITLLGYFIYAKNLLNSTNESILSLIFLISMPLLILNLLIYAARSFVMIFLIYIIYFSIQKFDMKKLIITSLLVFCLIFSHTGSFMFLLFFSIGYFLLSSLVWKKFEPNMYYLTVIEIFMYVFTVHVFPFVQPQYIDKGRIIMSISGWLSSVLRQPYVGKVGTILYENLFVSNNLIYALFWSSLIFSLGKLLISLREELELLDYKKFRAIPFLGSLTSMSHGVIQAPFWIGPIQTLLSIPGIFKIDNRGKCIALSLFFAAILPAALQSAESGSLREMYYLFLIIPITAAAGFYSVLAYLHSSRADGSWKILNRWKKNKLLKKVLPVVFCLVIFIPLIIVPIVGNLYYQLDISGTTNEKENLIWLGKIGTPNEGLPGYYYRERINFYANKTIPSVPSGSETTRSMKDFTNTLFSSNSEGFTKDLHSFNIQYIILSDKILKNLQRPFSAVTVDANKQLDKIYSSDNRYGIYRYITEPQKPELPSSQNGGLYINDGDQTIQDLDPIYLFENDFYKVKLSHSTPSITYIGSKIDNILGEGGFYDALSITWSGSKQDFASVDLNELTYSVNRPKNNTIVYQTVVGDSNGERWATLIITYTFYEKAVKREMIIAHDWVDTSAYMNVHQSNAFFAPILEFSYNQLTDQGNSIENKIIYPSQDNVVIKDKKFNELYLKKDDSGLLIRYGDSAPFPTRLSYQGSTIYDYSTISIDSGSALAPSEPMTLTQYWSVGDRYTAATNIDKYQSIKPSLFQNATIPIGIIGFVDRDYYREYSENGIKLYKDSNIPFYEIINSGSPGGLEQPENVIGLINIYKDQKLKTSENIRKEIQNYKNSNHISGISFKYFEYNLGTVKTINDEGIAFIPAFEVTSPYMEFFREGLRDPVIAYYHGQKTGVTLLPVTTPFSSTLSPTYDAEKAFSEWNETAISVREDGGILVFLWDAKDFGNPDYSNRFLAQLRDLINKGMSYSDLESVSTHLRDLQNITLSTTMELDSASIVAINHNLHDVSGISVRVKLPSFETGCPYSVINGSLQREEFHAGICDLFVSFDLRAKEHKAIFVQTNIIKQKFNTTFPSIYTGDNLIVVRDSNGDRVKNASVLIDGRRVDADDQGEAILSVERGVHNIKFEKPGFYPIEFQIEAKGKIYKIARYLGIKIK